MTSMRVDWHRGTWRIWDLESGAKLAESRSVSIRVPCELVNADNNLRGFLIVAGAVTVDGDAATIAR